MRLPPKTSITRAGASLPFSPYHSPGFSMRWCGKPFRIIRHELHGSWGGWQGSIRMAKANTINVERLDSVFPCSNFAICCLALPKNFANLYRDKRFFKRTRAKFQFFYKVRMLKKFSAVAMPGYDRVSCRLFFVAENTSLRILLSHS